MTVGTALGSQIIAEELVLQGLLDHCTLVGGIYTMAYDHCLVLTNDLWKQRAGGIPQHCFLLATAMVPGKAPEIDDEEVLLLRVVGPAPLPAESELLQVREEAMRKIVTSDGLAATATTPAILDVLTRNEIQFSGVRAKVIGTFYEDEVGGGPLLTFGSDVDTYYSSSRYKVYKPHGESLAMIASYPEATADELAEQHDGVTPRRIEIGTVRYSSTERRRRRNAGTPKDTAVPVRVNVQDFIALKTAIFGMTRLGKSNTMKTIATAICQYGAETGQSIGQLLFDPAGEYANVNVQDRTALAAIGSEYVTIFRYGADVSDDNVRSLTTNFFAETTISVTWSIISDFLSATQDAGYVKSFLAADVIGPEKKDDDYSAYNRAGRRRSALFATLVKAGFKAPDKFEMTVATNKKALEAINAKLDAGKRPTPFESDRSGNVRLSVSELLAFWNAVDSARSELTKEDWIDSELDAILTVFRGSTGRGYRILEQLRIYHSPEQTEDYAREVLNELILGKIVIVDLSLGSEAVLQSCSERIVNYIVRDASQRFTEGKPPRNIQIYIEEAHRLFGREHMKESPAADPYVRLAKEAAKFRIGLIYATQEVSSVDPIILSNTSNWIVTHLNNRNEVKELSKYYDFEDFAELTLNAEDVGFARLKSRSGRFIVPVQIALFDQGRVDAVRAALGMANLSED